jgi:hypothetical protein
MNGCDHAAVSATYAVANAINCKALAVSYAAYATVYASGGYAAVADREAFEPEFAWQLAALKIPLIERGRIEWLSGYVNALFERELSLSPIGHSMSSY